MKYHRLTMKIEVYMLPKGSNIEKSNIVKLKKKDAKALPDWVHHSLAQGILVVNDGNLYGYSIAHILGQ